MDVANDTQLGENDQMFKSHSIRIVVDRACLNDILGSLEINYTSGDMGAKAFVSGM